MGDWNSTTINGSAQSRTHGAAHELTGVSGNAVSYDTKGNLSQDDNLRALVWDFDNRLKSTTLGGDSASYTYDALGRRVSKNVNGTITVYVCMVVAQQGFSGGQVCAEYAGSAAAANPQQKYVYGSYIDEPLMKIDGAEGKLYYHTNRLFHVQALTDGAGAIVEGYQYDAYGRQTVFTNAGGDAQWFTSDDTSAVAGASALGNPYMYTGRRFDPETGLFYYRARYFSSELGRFVSRDPIGYEAGSLGLYEYVGGNSYFWIDPFGLEQQGAMGGWGGGCVEFITDIIPAASSMDATIRQ